MSFADASFSNIDAVKKAVDPHIFKKAVGSTIRQLSDKAATLIAKTITKKYPVKRVAIKSVLRKSYTNSSETPARILTYAAGRISLRHYATKSPRPIVVTSRGIRRGAKVKDRKGTSPRIVKGGFFGKARTSGSQQIFIRKGLDLPGKRAKLKKATGPGVSQMVRGTDVLDQVNKFISLNADTLLQKNLDHFTKKQIGVR